MRKSPTLLLFFSLFSLFFLVSQQQLLAKKENSVSKTKPVVGNVKEVTADSLTVEGKNSKKESETEVDQTTKVIGQDKKALRLRQIKLNDKVAIISSESADLGKKKKAVKIFVKQASTSAQLKRRAVHGVVSSISGATITLVHQIQKDRNYIVTTNATTSIKLKGTQDATLASITVGQRLVAVGIPSTDGSLLATRIHVIPGNANGVFKKNPITPGSSTPSASLTPSLTGTVTPTVTGVEEVTPTFTITDTPSLIP